MNIGSGLDTVSSLYGQQKSNYMKAPASAEKTFYTAETPKVYQIFTTDNMLWTGGNGTGLSYCLKYRRKINEKYSQICSVSFGSNNDDGYEYG